MTTHACQAERRIVIGLAVLLALLLVVDPPAARGLRSSMAQHPDAARGRAAITVTPVPLALVVDQTAGDALVARYYSSSATGGASGRGRIDELATRQGGLHLLRTVQAVGHAPGPRLEAAPGPRPAPLCGARSRYRQPPVTATAAA